MSEQREKITVAICAYNVEDYIEQCIRSVMTQTYQNLEILIIDDGSADNTGKILDNLAKEDSRIKLIHKKNEGLAAGREQVVQIMTSDLLYWVDGDDWLLENAVADSYEVMVSTGADIVKSPIKPADRQYAGTYTRDEYLKLLLPDIYIKANNIGCLIKKELYHNVHHKPGLINDDYDTFPQLMRNADKIVVTDDHNYCYRIVRPGSITYNGRSKFRGFYPRAVHRISRYKLFHEEYPKECEIVLSQFVDNACMACLFAGKHETRVEEVKAGMIEFAEEVVKSDKVSRYKKWLYKQIIENRKIVPFLKILHFVKSNIKTRKDRLLGRG